MASINPIYCQQVADILQQLKAHGKTILLVEHNSSFIEDVADQIFFLNQGSIFHFDTLEQLRKDTMAIKSFS